MKYEVQVYDTATYEIEADSMERASEIAHEWFDERKHKTLVTESESEHSWDERYVPSPFDLNP